MGARRTGREEREESDELVDALLESHDSRDSGDSGAALTATSAGALGLRNIVDLTGREPVGVTLVEPAKDGWTVEVEVVEDRRIPSTGDVLALYSAHLSPQGDLVSYRRLRRYRRGSGDASDRAS